MSNLEKQVKEPLTPFQKGKGLLHETQTGLQEAKTILQETLSKLQKTQKQDKEDLQGKME